MKWRAWMIEYPEEGSVWLDARDEDDAHQKACALLCMEATEDREYVAVERWTAPIPVED